MSDTLKEIKIPSLNSTDYGAALSEQFGNINLNFQKIANTGLYKGDDGKSSQYIPYNLNAIFVYCTEEDTTTSEFGLFSRFQIYIRNSSVDIKSSYRRIAKEVEDDYAIYNNLTARTKAQYAQDVATILYGRKHVFDIGTDEVINNSLVGSVYCPNSENLKTTISFDTHELMGCWLHEWYRPTNKEGNPIEIGVGEYVMTKALIFEKYIDYNPGRILMFYTLDNQDITYLGSFAYIYIDPRFRNEYIGKVEVSDWGNAEDVSCVIYWDNSIQGFRSLNLFPQIYFDGSGFFWKINDQKTHIPVSGPAGTDGKSSRMYVCVRKEMINSAGTLSTPVAGNFVVSQSVYTGKPAHNTTDLEKIKFGESDIPDKITANKETHQYSFNSAIAWQSETATYANVDPSNIFEVASVMGYETLTNAIKQELDGASCIVLPGDGFSLNRSNNVVWFTNFKTTTNSDGDVVLSVFCSDENQLTTEIDEHIFAGLMMSLDPFDYKAVSDNRNKPRGLYIPIGSVKVEGSGSEAYAAHVIYSDNNPLYDHTNNSTKNLAGAKPGDNQTQVVVDKKILHIGSVNNIQDLNQCESFEKPAVPGIAEQYTSSELHIDEPVVITAFRNTPPRAYNKPLLQVESDVVIGSQYYDGDEQEIMGTPHGGLIVNSGIRKTYTYDWIPVAGQIKSLTSQSHDIIPSIATKNDIYGDFLVSKSGVAVVDGDDPKFFVDGSGNISYSGRYNLNSYSGTMVFGSRKSFKNYDFGWFSNPDTPLTTTKGQKREANIFKTTINSNYVDFSGTVRINGAQAIVSDPLSLSDNTPLRGLEVGSGIVAGSLTDAHLIDVSGKKVNYGKIINNNGSGESINPAFYTEDDSVYAGDAVVASRFIRNLSPSSSNKYRLLMDNGWSTSASPIELYYEDSFLKEQSIYSSWYGDGQAQVGDTVGVMRLQPPTPQIFQKNGLSLYLYNDCWNSDDLYIGSYGGDNLPNPTTSIWKLKGTDPNSKDKIQPQSFAIQSNISIELDVNKITFDIPLQLNKTTGKIKGITSTTIDKYIFPETSTFTNNYASMPVDSSGTSYWFRNTGRWKTDSAHNVNSSKEHNLSLLYYTFLRLDDDEETTILDSPNDNNKQQLSFSVETNNTITGRAVFGYKEDPNESSLYPISLSEIFKLVVKDERWEYKNPIEPVFVTLNGEVGSVNFAVDTEGRLLFVSCTSDYKFKGDYVNLRVSWSNNQRYIINKPSTGKDSYEVIDSGTLINPTPSASGTLINPIEDPSKKQATKQNPFVYGRQVYEDGSVGNWELISQYVGTYTYIASTDVAYTTNSKMPVPGGFIAFMNGDIPYKLGGFSNYIPAGDAKYVVETSDGYIDTSTDPGTFGDNMLEYCKQYKQHNMESFNEFTLPGYGHMWRILTNTWESEQWKASDFDYIGDNSEDVTDMFLSTVPSTMKSAYGGHTVKCSYENSEYRIETNFDDTAYDTTDRRSSVSIFKQDTWENKPEYVNLFFGIMFREIINRNGEGSMNKVYAGDQIGWTMKNQDVIFSNAGQHRNNMSARIVEITPTDDSDTSKRILQSRVRMYVDMMGISDDILGIKGMVDFTVDSLKWEDKYYVADEYNIRNLSGTVLDDPKWLVPHITMNNTELIFESCTDGSRSTCHWESPRFLINKIS